MIEILDANMRKIDPLHKYTFSQYEDKFREVGIFQIDVQVVPETNYLINKAKEYFVLFNNQVFGKIENIQKESDNEYENTMTIKGRLAPMIFTKRVVYGTIKFNGKSYEMVKQVIDSQMVSNSNRQRNMPITITYDNETYMSEKCSTIDKEVTGGTVWEAIEPLLKQDKMGLYFDPVIVPSEEDNPNITGWNLTISVGADRSKRNTQGNEPIVFSQDLSNLARSSYSLDSENYCNVAYVAGAGEGSDRKWYEVYRDDESQIQSWGRRELWIDARDIQSSSVDGSGTITDEEYEALINQRASEKFAENSKQEEYTFTVTDNDKRYKYGRDYKKGDIVTISDVELNVEIDAQITGVTVSEQDSDEIIDIELTMGGTIYYGRA